VPSVDATQRRTSSGGMMTGTTLRRSHAPSGASGAAAGEAGERASGGGCALAPGPEVTWALHPTVLSRSSWSCSNRHIATNRRHTCVKHSKEREAQRSENLPRQSVTSHPCIDLTCKTRSMPSWTVRLSTHDRRITVATKFRCALRTVWKSRAAATAS